LILEREVGAQLADEKTGEILEETKKITEIIENYLMKLGSNK
jgi:hypothetical protein